MATKAFAIIAGVGPGTGAAVARKFATHYSVALLARRASNYEPLVDEINKSGGRAIGFSTDVTDAKSVKEAIAECEKSFGAAPLAAAIYNVGGRFIRKPFLELSLEEFEAGYEANGRGAFLFSQATLPLLLKASKVQYPPSLIFTGATASLRGSAQCASFAVGKFAVRALSQSLAREYGPKGIHVCHTLVDGQIDVSQNEQGEDATKISPEGIADVYWHLHTQPRSTFTHEVDVRPFGEKW